MADNEDSEEECPFIQEKHSCYSSNILRKLSKNRKDGVSCDVVLNVGEKVHFGHRSVLSVACPFFEKLFNCDMKEKASRSVDLQLDLADDSSDVFDKVLEYFYSGEIEITSATAKGVITVANYLLLDDLKLKASLHLRKEFTGENVLSTMALAKLYSCEYLLSATKDYVCNNFKKVSKTEEFLQLQTPQLIDIISDKKLVAKKEHEVLEAVFKWAEADGKRIKKFPEVIGHVRLGCVSKEYLKEIALNRDVVNSCHEASTILGAFTLSGKHLNELKKAKADLFKPRSCCDQVPVILVTGEKNEHNNWCNEPVKRFIFNPEDKQCYVLPDWNEYSRRLYGAGVCQNKFYVMSGAVYGGSTDSVEYFDPETLTWKESTPYPCEDLGITATSMGDLLYTMDGDDVGILRYFHPLSGTWKKSAARMRTPRLVMGLASLGWCLYAISGLNKDEKYLRSCEKYDPATDEWTPICPLFPERLDMPTLTMNNKIYVFGGDKERSESSPCPVLRDVDVYDPEADEWDNVTEMPGLQEKFGVSAVNGKFYIFGGRSIWNATEGVEGEDPHYCDREVEDIQIYDLEKNEWSSVGLEEGLRDIVNVKCGTIMLKKSDLKKLKEIDTQVRKEKYLPLQE